MIFTEIDFLPYDQAFQTISRINIVDSIRFGNIRLTVSSPGMPDAGITIRVTRQ